MLSREYRTKEAHSDAVLRPAAEKQANRSTSLVHGAFGREGVKTKFQLMADQSRQTAQFAAWRDVMNAHAGHAGRFPVHSVAQLKKKKKGIWCAESESEARSLMSPYAGKIGLTWSAFPESLRELCVEHAQDPDKDGINGGETLLFGEKREIEEKQRKAARANTVKTDYATISALLTDDLAKAAFSVARSTYVGGASVNAGVSGSHSEDDYYDAKAEWDAVDNYTTINNFHSFDPEDKAAKGKGNVADTLATREVQGNLLCNFDGKKINVHVDIAE